MSEITDNRHILITGTTSGIGLGILKHYHAQGWTVTAVNRTQNDALEKQFPGTDFQHFDVRDLASVKKYFTEAAAKNKIPTLYFLSAGVNKVDNVGDFDLEIFKEVMDINYQGVMNFVAEALPRVQGRRAVFVGASSTTNLFANPNCVGYFVSKLAIYRTFKMMDQKYRASGIRFKSIILGPVATGIFVSGKLSSKLQATVRDVITVTVEESVPKIVRFIHSNCTAFYYPKLAVLLFITLRIINNLIPGFYKGSAPSEK